MTASTSLAISTQERIEKILPDLGWGAAKQKKAANQLIALVVDAAAALARHTPPTYSDAALGGGMARAIEEGEQFKSRMMGRSDMLAPERAAAKAGISRQALDLRRKKHLALALSHGKRGFRYPAWQFSDALAEPMQVILPLLSNHDAWSGYLLLTEPEPLLDGLSVVSTLRAGRVAQAVDVVRKLTQADNA